MTASVDTVPRQHSGWTPEKFGPFLGRTFKQAAVVVGAMLLLLGLVALKQWGVLLRLLPVVALVVVLTVVPVKSGKPVGQWLAEAAMFGVARAAGWAAFQSKAGTGTASVDELTTPDLPGVLSRLNVFEGPQFGMGATVGVVHNPPLGSWAATARVEHPGLGTLSNADADRLAAGLGDMLAEAAQTEQINRISVCIRTVPSDGTARAAWVEDSRVAGVPDIIETIGEVLEAQMSLASVRHEVFVTVAVDEAKIRKQAKAAGGGPDGRAAVLYRNLRQAESGLRGIGATGVEWLGVPDLMEAVRCGYSPADAAVFERARQAKARGQEVATSIPVGAAGPVNAPAPSARVYHHDGYATVGYALILPDRSAQVGGMARMFAPSSFGERRSVTLHYQPVPQRVALDKAEGKSFLVDFGRDAKARMGFRATSADQRVAGETVKQEQEVANGHTVTRIAGAAAVTVPADLAVEDHAAEFEADVRSCGWTAMRADLAQDTAFVAAVLPLGVGMSVRGGK